MKKARTLCDLKEMELLRLWRIFIQPNPWEIISFETITSLYDFHQALVNACFREESGKWRAKGLASGVFDRLFRMRRKGCGITFEEFLKLAYVLSYDTGKQYRLVLCFQFCDWDGDGIIQRDELVRTLEMFDNLYKSGAGEVDRELFCEVALMKGDKPGNIENLKRFEQVCVLHPLLLSFFKLDDVLSGGLHHLAFNTSI